MRRGRGTGRAGASPRIKGTKMMGSVHPASPSRVHNEARMIEPHTRRANRQADFKKRHGYGIT